MVYDWNSRAQSATEEDWLPVSELIQFVRFCASLQFTVVARRQAAIDYYGQLRRDAPFSVDVRVPEWKGFVRLFRGDWPNKFAQLLSALNFRNADTVQSGKFRRGEDAQNQQQEVHDTVPNDVLQSFTKAVQSIEQQIAKREYIYTRESIEDELSLTWT